MYARKAIGIMGGVGPYAGLDLMRKILDNTSAHTDQEHLPILHFCYPNQIMGRPDFLDGLSPINPGEVIGEIMVDLARAGATVIGMPCNTAHSPAIVDKALETLRTCAQREGLKVTFVHMINEVAQQVLALMPKLRKVGVLGTPAVCRAGVYQNAFAPFNVEVIYPLPATHTQIQRAVLDDVYGIKAESNPVTARAVRELEEAAGELVSMGAEAVIMGCTEIPLALTQKTLYDVPLIDATDMLARALILAFAPDRLKR